MLLIFFTLVMIHGLILEEQRIHWIVEIITWIGLSWIIMDYRSKIVNFKFIINASLFTVDILLCVLIIVKSYPFVFYLYRT